MARHILLLFSALLLLIIGADASYLRQLETKTGDEIGDGFNVGRIDITVKTKTI